MLAQFYRKFSKQILWGLAISFPILMVLSDQIPVNNDIETWLPEHSPVRETYNEFKETFGGEEIILIGLNQEKTSPRLVHSIMKRVERLEEVDQCWDSKQLTESMNQLGVTEKEIQNRLEGLVYSEDRKLSAIIIAPSATGYADRVGTVAKIREELSYCQIQEEDYHLAGTPVIVAELDRLGNKENSERFFLFTLIVSLVLLYISLRDWKLSLSILALTVWAIKLTDSMIWAAGGEMNFIMGALSVMVMVFTLAVSIHFIHYYKTAMGSHDPLGTALKLAWKPCFLATLTTSIGLASLAVSDILPVRQFGFAAAAGSIISLFTGLGLTPAVMMVLSSRTEKIKHRKESTFFADFIIEKRKMVAILAGGIVLGCSSGLVHLKSLIDPLDFLPRDSKILADAHTIQDNLSGTSSIEAVLKLKEDLPVIDKLTEVRRIERILLSHPCISKTVSAATFFPNKFPDSAMATANILKKAQAQKGGTDYVAGHDTLWRISARLKLVPGYVESEVYHELKMELAKEPVTLTGVSPLLDSAQKEIFVGFWESFSMAFVIITGVMIIALKSLRIGLLAMIPNLTPICIVFGILGWSDFPVDIGMMMTGSIALGIAVDGTFHFLIRYNELKKNDQTESVAVHAALHQTGKPIFQAAAIAGIGMLALSMSIFVPTARFGWMMATLLLTALIGDLVLLPAIMALTEKKKTKVEPEIEADIKEPYILKMSDSKKAQKKKHPVNKI
jgi:uncharacterized protein